MGRPSGMNSMVHDYKERKKRMKESGRYWEVETGGDFIRVTAEAHHESLCNDLSITQGENDDGILLGIGEIEEFIEALHTAKGYLEITKKERS